MIAVGDLVRLDRHHIYRLRKLYAVPHRGKYKLNNNIYDGIYKVVKILKLPSGRYINKSGAIHDLPKLVAVLDKPVVVNYKLTQFDSDSVHMVPFGYLCLHRKIVKNVAKDNQMNSFLKMLSDRIFKIKSTLN